MGTSLQAMVENANRKSAASRGKQFVKRSSDEQMLERLLSAAGAVLDLVDREGLETDKYLPGLVLCGEGIRPLLVELRTAVALAKRRQR